MQENAKTLVGMVGRRFIRDHQLEFAELLGLDKSDRKLIKAIKIALRAQVTVPTLRAALRLPTETSVAKLAEAVKEYVSLQKELKAWNVKTVGNEEDDLDELSRVWYETIPSH